MRRYVPASLFLLSVVAIILSAARPAATIPVPVNPAAVMLARDVAPNRMEAAKAAALEFVRKLSPAP